MLIFPFLEYILNDNPVLKNFYVKISISYGVGFENLKSEFQKRKFKQNCMIDIWPIYFFICFVTHISDKGRHKFIKYLDDTPETKFFCDINLLHSLSIHLFLPHLLQNLFHIWFVVGNWVKSKSQHYCVFGRRDMWEVLSTDLVVI